MLTTDLRPRAPYDLALSARGHSEPSRRLVDRALHIRFRVDEQVAAAAIRQRGDGSLEVGLEVGESARDAAMEHVRFVLAVDLDHRPFLELAERDPVLRETIGRRRGYRPLRSATVGHALLRALCGQLVTYQEALRIERQVLRSLADPTLPPTRADLAALAPAGLERCGLAGRRAAALVRVARTIDLEGLHDHPTAAVVARIVRERDLGPWSAGVICVTGLGRYEQGLVGDLGLLRLAGALLGRRAETGDTADLLARYGPWAGLASHHLLAHPLAGSRREPVSPSRVGGFAPREAG